MLELGLLAIERVLEGQGLATPSTLHTPVGVRALHGIAQHGDELHLGIECVDPSGRARVEEVVGRRLPDRRCHSSPAPDERAARREREPCAVPAVAPLVVAMEVLDFLHGGAEDARVRVEVVVERGRAAALRPDHEERRPQARPDVARRPAKRASSVARSMRGESATFGKGSTWCRGPSRSPSQQAADSEQNEGRRHREHEVRVGEEAERVERRRRAALRA